MKLPLSVIILTYNEEVNITDCLKSIVGIAKEIFIVDSFSTDETINLAKKYGCYIYQNEFKGFSNQINWAIKNLPIKTEWVLRLDADEYLTNELVSELQKELGSLPTSVNGIFLKRRVYFFNKWIKYGDYYPVWLLRLWRNGCAQCEERLNDDHVHIGVLKGEYLKFKHDFIDKNNKLLHWWTLKHNSYATNEAINLLALKYKFYRHDFLLKNKLGKNVLIKRFLKENLYSRLPLFFRVFIYFIYRYFIKLGFLDGKEGLIWHFLQGFWYRFLIDAKMYEIEVKTKIENKPIKDIIKDLYHVEV